MAYIGREPTVGNFQVCDAISTVNNQAAYTMQVGGVNVSPESANHILVSLNGILQKPGSSFTVSGSTITFASNLVTGDVINFIHILGSVLDLGVPSDATVTTAKLADSSVSLAKLTATGTKDATTFLRGDNTFAAAGGGVSNAFMTEGLASNASGTIVFNNELFDDGGNYNTSNGRYTAPSNGKYIFFFQVLGAGVAAEAYYQINGSVPGGQATAWTYTAGGSYPAGVTAIFDLTASQYVTVVTSNTVYNNYCFFGGAKLY